MARVLIRTYATGFDETNDRLDAVHDRIRDFRPIFRGMHEDLVDAWRRNFLTNGSLVGGWAPLDKEYGSWKSRNFPGTPPMIRSGELFQSLGDLRGKANDIDKMEAQFGTDIEYAKFHQYGTSKMPKREIVFEPFGFAEKWGREMAQYIVDGKDDGRGES